MVVQSMQPGMCHLQHWKYRQLKRIAKLPMLPLLSSRSLHSCIMKTLGKKYFQELQKQLEEDLLMVKAVIWMINCSSSTKEESGIQCHSKRVSKFCLDSLLSKKGNQAGFTLCTHWYMPGV